MQDKRLTRCAIALFKTDFSELFYFTASSKYDNKIQEFSSKPHPRLLHIPILPESKEDSDR